jgi:hypothetical protein
VIQYPGARLRHVCWIHAKSWMGWQ